MLHCPYCHGWEVRDQAIGILSSGPNSTHQALLFRQLSDDVIYFSHTMPPDQEQTEQLRARGIQIVDGVVTSLKIADDKLTGVGLADGSVMARDAVVVAPRMVARAGFLSDLGLKAEAHPSGMGDYIKVDPAGLTVVSGVWAAGNVADLAAQVGGSASAGAWAAARINADLVEEETHRALQEQRDTSRASS